MDQPSPPPIPPDPRPASPLEPGGEAPSPFDRPGSPPSAPRRGVAKPLMVGCGVLVVLAVAALALFVAYQNVVVAWIVEAVESQVSPLLPDDLPPATRARYDAAFERAAAAARAGTYDPFALQGLQRELSRLVAARQAGDLSPDDVERLIGVVESLPAGEEDPVPAGAGGPPATVEPETSPAPAVPPPG